MILGEFAPPVSHLVLLLALFGALPDGGVAPAAQLVVRAKVEKAQLGEHFEVEYVITHDKGQRYELVPPSETGDFDYLSQQRSRKDGPTSTTTTVSVSWAAFALGRQTTPKVQFEVTQIDGSTRVNANGADIEIVSTLPADADKKGAALYDVHPAQPVPVRTYRLLWILGVVIAGLLLAFAISRFLARPRTVKPFAPKPLAPLHLRTLASLDALRQANLPAKGDIKHFYFRLSEIIRSYLGERYGFDALECTTPELMAALYKMHTPGLSQSGVRAFAEQSDFARYAKAIPTLDECKGALEFAYATVKSTTPELKAPDAQR